MREVVRGEMSTQSSERSSVIMRYERELQMMKVTMAMKFKEYCAC